MGQLYSVFYNTWGRGVWWSCHIARSAQTEGSDSSPREQAGADGSAAGWQMFNVNLGSQPRSEKRKLSRIAEHIKTFPAYGGLELQKELQAGRVLVGSWLPACLGFMFLLWFLLWLTWDRTWYWIEVWSDSILRFGPIYSFLLNWFNFNE